MNKIPIESDSPLAEAVDIAGSQAKLAAGIDESQQNISNWLKCGIPKDKRHSVAMKLERFTNGKVPRQRVCPGDWHEMWPELAEQVPQPEAEATGSGEG